MRLFIKQITVFSLSTLVLFSTTGVSLHTLYCACKKQLSVSFFPLESQCCQLKKPKSCCQKETHSGHAVQKKKHNCETKGTRFLKLSTPLEHSQQVQKAHFVQPLDAVPVVFAFVDGPRQHLRDNPSTGPPDGYGRQLRIQIRSFLC